MIMCSGAEKLCKFKYEFFAEWPEYLLHEINKTEMLLDCDTLEKYAQFMDIIFNVKYIERTFELKAKVDNKLLNLHPHMTYIVIWYDALLYRYCCSSWVTQKGLHLEEEVQKSVMKDLKVTSKNIHKTITSNENE